MRKTPFWIIAVFAVAGLASCGEQPTKPAPPTIQHLMINTIDPNADEIWEAIGTVESEAGVVERVPATDAEWVALAARAQTLVDGSRRLASLRTVGGVADAHVPGTRTAAQISADIAADPPRFEAHAGRLTRAAQDSLDAIRARDRARILVAGEELDAACEACHAAYWFPRIPPPRLPDYETFDRQAARP